MLTTRTITVVLFIVSAPTQARVFKQTLLPWTQWVETVNNSKSWSCTGNAEKNVIAL